MINLITINETIVSRIQHLRDQVGQTGEAIELSVGVLKEYLPELAQLNLLDETIFTRLFLLEGQVQAMTLKVYVDDDDDKPKVFDAAANPQPVLNLQFIQYETGLGGYQVVMMGKHKVKIALSIDNAYRKQLEEADEPTRLQLIRKGSGTPPLQLLKYRPRATTPLRKLEIGNSYQVLKKTGTSKKYSPNRYLIQAADGTEFETYSNQSLEQLILRRGIPCDFEILSKNPTKDGTGIIVKVASPDSASLAALVV